jgi:diguanylate cyclase (GGDEF)-like protein/PAS domain S-box-containing protein
VTDSLLVRALSRLTLAARLTLGAALALGAVSTALLVTSTVREADYLREVLHQEVTAAFATQLPALADQAVIGDYAVIEQRLKAQVSHSDIRRMTWRAVEGGVVEATDKPTPVDAPRWFADWLAIGEPKESHSLTIGGRDYGTLTIEMSATADVDRLWHGFVSHAEILALAAGLTFLAILMILRYSLRPLNALIAGAGRLGRGELATRIESRGSPEMRQAILAFNYMAEDLAATLHELDESRENLSITLQSIGDAVVATDCDGVVTELNQVAQQLTGWSQAEAKGQPLTVVFPIVSAATRQPIDNPVARVLATGLVVGLANHTTLVARDGREYQIADSAAPIRNRDGKIVGIVLVFRDVTQEYLLRQAAHENEERFRALFDQAAVGMAQMDKASGALVRVNQRFADILGYQIRELEQTNWHELTHVADREGDRALLTRLAAAEVREVCQEIRLLRRDGSSVWVAVTVSPMGVSGHAADHNVVIVQDVSERRRAEQELRIAAAAFESEEGMIVTDANEVILRVNHAFTAMTGYGADEVLGQTPRVLKSGHHDRAFYRQMWETLSRDRYWQGEIWNRRKSGELFPVWQTISAVLAPDGRISHYVAAFTDISARKAAEEQIRNLAFYDPLTQLPNRRLLIERLGIALVGSAHSRRHSALLFLDLDYFKVLNDTEGHDVGDQLLVEVARRVRSSVREGDTVARLGGDEFVVMLEELSDDPDHAAAQAETVGQKIREAVAQPYRLKDHDYHGSASIGVCLFRDGPETVDDLLKRADVAMYQAKSSGRNTLRFFQPEMELALVERAAMEVELRHVLQHQELVLYYQPQIDENNRVLGAEALLRWQHPERGLVSPVDFIPVAEETGLIVPIGRWVLETACMQLREWQQNEATSHLVLAVNVSARQFRQPDFVDQVEKILLAAGVDPSCLKLELTESVVLDDVADTIEKMKALKVLGVGFSMDDFGTGYSSLSYLRRLPLEQLKIDRSFVRDVESNTGDAVIVQTIIGMAQSLGLKVIAEGVESHGQRDFLSRHGCPAFQGFLFSRPVPAAMFELLIPPLPDGVDAARKPTSSDTE